MKILNSAVAAIVLGMFLVACEDDAGGGNSFDQALRDGGSCQRLFDLRNQADPSSQERLRMDAELRRVGCLSSSSQRTD